MMFEYKLIRAKRKTVGITVCRDGTVTVRAPARLSKKEIEKIIEKHRPWIEKKQAQIREINREELSEDDKMLLRSLAERIIPERLSKASAKTGLIPKKVRVSSAEKRFGSCSSAGSVSVSFYAMMYPDEAIELILYHELCHLVHMDHSADFYRLLSSFLPDHKERKLLLKNARLTMEEVRKKYSDYL
ncbi:MAG: M48 family metallopeptidase [Ruminococcaceae bacterium]|nr:M48 family metallopeptidase [Oscillospiraceae bacterium]